MNKTKVKLIGILGAIFIIIAGSMFHFAYDYLGKIEFTGIFFPINESVWEHLKLVYFPIVLLTLIESRFFLNNIDKFIISKVITFFIISISIVVLFYSYTFLLKDNNFIFDILIFIISVIIGQYVNYKILTSYVRFNKTNFQIAIFLGICMFILFSIFTFYPPNNFLFIDYSEYRP